MQQSACHSQSWYLGLLNVKALLRLHILLTFPVNIIEDFYLRGDFSECEVKVLWSVSKCVFRHARGLKLHIFQSYFDQRNILSFTTPIPLHISSTYIISSSDNGPISHVTQDTCCEPVIIVCVPFLQWLQLCSNRWFLRILVLAVVCLCVQFMYNSCPSVKVNMFCT